MRKVQVLAIICMTLSPTLGLAENAPTKAQPAQAARKTPPPAVVRPLDVVRQDLFDRNNPNNLRSDYPAPSAQPGQF